MRQKRTARAYALSSRAAGEIGYALYRVLAPRKTQSHPTKKFLVTALDSEYVLPYFIKYTPEQILEKTGASVLPDEYTKPRKTFLTFCFGVGSHVARWEPSGAVGLSQLCGWMLSQLDAWGVPYRDRRPGIPPEKRKDRTIVVLSHYMISELQHITDGSEAFREYGSGYVGYTRFADEPETNDVRSLKIEVRKEGIKFVFIDTWPIFGISLEKLTTGSPYAKRLDDELWHGKPWGWWRRNPDLTFQEDPETFWKYAEDDVRGLLFAVNKWRAIVWNLWNVDILIMKTFGAIALRILQGHYLTEPTEAWIRRRERGLGELGTSSLKYSFNMTDGVWVSARLTAILGYKGGRREVMKPGYTEEPVYAYDVSKEYTVAAIMQPLPNPNTKLVVFDDQRGKPPSEFDGCEGIVECDFKFPAGTRYPCLPVEHPEVGMLLFPLEGRTTCGLAEIRLAARLGAEVRVFRGFTFKPGPDEINHSVRRFLEDVLRRANELSGTPGEKFFKNIANGLVGKLCQRDRERTTEKTLWKDKFAMAGPGWSPILAALILSRARAIYGELLTLGDVVYGHTDSIFSLKPIDLDAPIVQELRKYGSDLKLENVYHPFWSPRAAVYYGVKQDRDGKPIVDVEGKAVVGTARHAISSDPEKFAEVLGGRVGQKGGVGKLWFVHRRQPKPGSGEPAGRTVLKITSPTDISKYDYKRKPNGPYDPWTEQGDTTPWENVAELIAYMKARRKKRLKQEREGRLRVIIAESDLARMEALRYASVSVNEIARQFPQYTRATIQRRLKHPP